MNAQDLKNSILQLAVQGKLVEQRPEEGTAKELLEQIKAEKEKLIKEKKIKNNAHGTYSSQKSGTRARNHSDVNRAQQQCYISIFFPFGLTLLRKDKVGAIYC